MRKSVIRVALVGWAYVVWPLLFPVVVAGALTAVLELLATPTPVLLILFFLLLLVLLLSVEKLTGHSVAAPPGHEIIPKWVRPSASESETLTRVAQTAVGEWLAPSRKKLFQSQQLTTAYRGAPDGYYRVPGGRTTHIKAGSCLLVETTGHDIPGVFVHVVTSGGLAGPANPVISNFTVPAGDAVPWPTSDLTLDPGDYLDAKAGLADAVTIHGSGEESPLLYGGGTIATDSVLQERAEVRFRAFGNTASEPWARWFHAEAFTETDVVAREATVRIRQGSGQFQEWLWAGAQRTVTVGTDPVLIPIVIGGVEGSGTRRLLVGWLIQPGIWHWTPLAHATDPTGTFFSFGSNRRIDVSVKWVENGRERAASAAFELRFGDDISDVEFVMLGGE